MSCGQAVDPTPFLVAPESIKALLGSLGDKKIVIEGTRVLAPGQLGVNSLEAKNEFRLKTEIIYFSGRGLAITTSHTDSSGQTQKDKILVLKVGTVAINDSTETAWLTRNDGVYLKDAFSWFPPLQLETFGLAAELSKSDTATIRDKERSFTMTVKWDGGHLTAVTLQEGERTMISMSSKFAASASLPVHTHREEFGSHPGVPWRTDDVSITLVPLREEDGRALAIIVPAHFAVSDSRKDPQAPRKRRGFEIGELLKEDGN